MSQNPRLSVVTVTWNALEDLKETWKSILEQDFLDWEWIVIDGASSDGSADFLRSISHLQVRSLSEPDSGIYNAMNKGLKLVKGEYVYFLNSGDTLASTDALKKVMARISGVGIFYSNIILKDVNSFILRIYPDKLRSAYWFKHYLCHQAVIFHSQVFKQLGVKNEEFRFAADFEFFMRAFNSRRFRFLHVNETLSVYDLQGVSASLQNREKIILEFGVIIRRNFNFFRRSFHWPPRSMLELKRFPGLIPLYLVNRYLYKAFSFFSNPSADPLDINILPATGPSGPVRRVLHLSSYLESGGASVAAVRLHRSLPIQGIESAVVVSHRDTHLPVGTAIAMKTGLRMKVFRIFEKIERALIILGRFSRKGHLSINWNTFCDLRQLDRILKSYRPDVVHLHWLGHGFLRIEDFSRLPKPVAWTFHDMWAFLSLDHLISDPQSQKMISEIDQKSRGIWNIDRWVWRRKKRAYQSFVGGIQGVCPSQWMMEASERSELMANLPRAVIPNIVDQSEFSPLSKEEARKALGLDKNSTVLLFGAFGPFIEENKGFVDFEFVVQKFRKEFPEKQLAVMTFGTGIGYRTFAGITHRHFESVRSTEFLRLIYSAADLTIVASRVESFCLVAAESMACGTPVVSYDTSGLKDIVDHKVNGYRAECYSPDDLYEGVKWSLSGSVHFQKISDLGVRKIAAISSSKIVGEKHRRLYEAMLSKSP